MKITLTIGCRFSAIHKLVPADHHEPLHGHDYKCYVTFKGGVDPLSGLLVSRDLVHKTLKDILVNEFHHIDLNEKVVSSSGEGLVGEIAKRLVNSPLGSYIKKVELVETHKNRFFAYVG